jgi:salicylate hydroxylase
MAVPRTVVIAGAGIGGLTAALAIARQGFRVCVLEAAERLEEIGAGIQLSPNASRILIALGLRDRLTPYAVAPEELKVMDAASGRVLTRAALGVEAERRYGAPYWMIHRGDLQAVLCEAVKTEPGISLQLGAKVEHFTLGENGVTITAHRNAQPIEERGVALIGADGLWSTLRNQLGHHAVPRFAHRTAWRALVPAEAVEPEFSTPAINLWLGHDAHLVHYPVKAGRLVNIVAILRDEWDQPGWSAPGASEELLARYPAARWYASARGLIGAATQWQKWALYDCAPLKHWGEGPITLLGDAAHPMLPYLAQGAAMAIEDAAVLGHCLGEMRDDPACALRAYEQNRRARTARTQRAAHSNGTVYHLGGIGALLRTLALRVMGKRLIRRYDWLYGWQPG